MNIGRNPLFCAESTSATEHRSAQPELQVDRTHEVGEHFGDSLSGIVTGVVEYLEFETLVPDFSAPGLLEFGSGLARLNSGGGRFRRSQVTFRKICRNELTETIYNFIDECDAIVAESESPSYVDIGEEFSRDTVSVKLPLPRYSCLLRSAS